MKKLASFDGEKKKKKKREQGRKNKHKQENEGKSIGFQILYECMLKLKAHKKRRKKNQAR